MLPDGTSSVLHGLLTSKQVAVSGASISKNSNHDISFNKSAINGAVNCTTDDSRHHRNVEIHDFEEDGQEVSCYDKDKHMILESPK